MPPTWAASARLSILHSVATRGYPALATSELLGGLLGSAINRWGLGGRQLSHGHCHCPSSPGESAWLLLWFPVLRVAVNQELLGSIPYERLLPALGCPAVGSY